MQKEAVTMQCSNCGAPLDENARFCNKCGAVNQATSRPDVQPGAASSVSPNPPYTGPAAAPAPYAAQPAAPVRKKRHIGCFIWLFLFLAIVGTILYFVGAALWLPPRDLGIRYTPADLDSAMSKIGLEVSYQGPSGMYNLPASTRTYLLSSRPMALLPDYADFIEGHRGEVLAIDDYTWEFSDYEQRSFVLTPEEATAFANEFAPQFSWFEDIQFKTFSDGRSACSCRVRFDKVRKELIADVADQIPSQVAAILPARFNLYTEGTFEIRNNVIIVPEPLKRLEVGTTPVQPLIGNLTYEQRNDVFDYVARIYLKIPNLQIDSLQVDADGNFAVTAYVPTKLTLSLG
jgi:hypothetical protein